MATYNTLPTVSEDALINQPKAPQNRKAIAIVAAVCFASASVGALVQPHAARGITAFNYHNAKQLQLAKYGGEPLCLGVASHDDAGPGSRLKLYPCKSDPSGQRFRFSRENTIKYQNERTGRQYCVTSLMGDFGDDYLLAACNGSDQQKFHYTDGVTQFRPYAGYGAMGVDDAELYASVKSMDTDDAWTRWYIRD